MAFNPKYSSIPIVSDNIGMEDVPILFPNGETIPQTCQGDTITSMAIVRKGYKIGTPLYITPPAPYYSVSPSADTIGVWVEIGGILWKTLPFVVEPAIYQKKSWCKVTAYDTTRYNYSSYPIIVYFKANNRKIEQQNVVVKYDDEVGTVIPLSQKQYDVLTFTTMPMNANYARLLLDVAEWDNLTFQYWDTETNDWSTPLNVAKKAEEWQKTTSPRTLGTTIQGSFVIKQ